MATYQDGNRRRATDNSRTAARRSAQSRRCPRCGRGAALIWVDEATARGRACRWEDCDFQDIHDPTSGPRPAPVAVLDENGIQA